MYITADIQFIIACERGHGRKLVDLAQCFFFSFY